MLDERVIYLKGLSKEYRIYRKNSQRLKAVFFGKGKCIKRLALDNIDLTIYKGENVAVLGNLGAGKTTLMKIISGIGFPTSGKAEIKGEVNALFDIKAGLDIELTGRDNLNLRAVQLGWTKDEIKKREDEIIELSGTAEYIDLPVKTYTAGMLGRLGFIIQTATRPDIFVMDAAMSVGDKVMREKCIQRLYDLVHGDDVTFIMVARNLPMTRKLCERGIVLEKGKIVFDGDVNEAINHYKQFYKVEDKKTEEEQMEDRAIALQFEEGEEDREFD